MTTADPNSDFVARQLEPAEVENDWDCFIRASPQANPFATVAWLRGASLLSGAELHFWGVWRGSQWVAGLPVTSRRLLGRAFYRGLPLAAYSSVILRAQTIGHPASWESEQIQAGRALARALARRYRLISLLMSPTIQDARAWLWEGWRVTPRFTYQLDLLSPRTPTDSVRRHVRKCDQAGCRLDTEWNLETFWEIFRETRERQGFGAGIERGAFVALAAGLHDAGIAWMATARSESGETVSSQIIMSVPQTPSAFMWVAGTRPAHLASGVSAWLMLKIATEAQGRGYQSWDLCGADYPSIARFKRELGATLGHYFQVDSPRSLALRAALALKRRRA